LRSLSNQFFASKVREFQISGDTCDDLHTIAVLEDGEISTSSSKTVESWICNSLINARAYLVLSFLLQLVEAVD
jgi:hypothetical protein